MPFKNFWDLSGKNCFCTMLPTGGPLEKIGDHNSGAKRGWYCMLLLCGKLKVVKSDKCFIGKKAGKMGEKCCMPGHNKSATG